MLDVNLTPSINLVLMGRLHLICVSANVRGAEYKGLKGVDISAAAARDFPKLKIKVLTFYASPNHVIATNAAAVQFNANGLSVSPCIVWVNPVTRREVSSRHGQG